MFNLGEFSMKKTLVALAALASMSAFAQSSVTLYGVADAWVGSLKQNSTADGGLTFGAISQTKLDSGGLSGSRWGMRGTEDLGGGLKANFVIEAGLNIDNGSNAQGLTYGRQTFLSLQGGFGTLSLGRQYSPYDSVKGALSIQNSTTFDATNGGVGGLTGAQAAALITGVGAAADLNAGLNAFSGRLGGFVGYVPRINNSIRYDSANFGGVSFAAMYGLGENKTATVGATSTTGLNVRYANGPIAIALAYQNDVLAKAAAGSTKLQNTMLAGNYDMGVAKLSLILNNFKGSVPGDSAKATEWAVGAAVPFGATTVKAQYARSKFKDADEAQNSLGLEVQYAMSKRTTAYFGLNNTKIQDDVKNRVTAFGLRHTF
jgi:predicted porin